MKLPIAFGLASALCALPGLAQAQDTAAAEALIKKNGCTGCHSVSAKKAGPSFKEVAAKYKGKADAEQKLVAHLTTNPKIKMGGAEETHAALKAGNDAELKNAIQYILTR